MRLVVKQERQQRKEALERERATSEILRVMAESRTDLQPVFDTIVRNAVRLCGGMFSNGFRYDGDKSLHPPAGRIQVTCGRRFYPGTKFMIFDIAKWLEARVDPVECDQI
jgi:sensor domain CHASE-containing protein